MLRYFEEEVRTTPKIHALSSDSNTLCENRVTTEVRLVHDWTDSRGI